ncbi:hypothetical protein KBC99_00640 [Candidatus Saccharibacteria bacterium]|nr:hypothetical protein [Candidatus Saccharibacteria bacterium]
MPRISSQCENSTIQTLAMNPVSKRKRRNHMRQAKGLRGGLGNSLRAVDGDGRSRTCRGRIVSTGRSVFIVN